MESARRYTSVNVRTSSIGARRSSGATQTNLFGQFLYTDREQDNSLSKYPNKKTEYEQPSKQEANSDLLEKAETNEPNDALTGPWEIMRNAGKIRNIAVAPRSSELSLRQIRQQCIMYILNLLTGFRRSDSEENLPRGISETSMQNTNPQPLTLTPVPLESTLFRRQELFYEQETTVFQTTGSVVTADGRTLDFNLEFQMSREFASYYEESVSLENARFLDPLVINLDTNVASVSDQKFFFDLDADGKEESISGLHPGSGYLALDINGNGIIDDGKELFGTTSGDGFLDLAKYDDDGNGWIDEKDAIFEKLLIWATDENGNSELYHLKEKDVGALYLGRVSTEHSLNDPLTNRANGVIRSSGLFLYENGTAGTLQQLDLAQ
ncbi:MAG: hypothetical protein PUD77_07475 [Clostridiales bacterium]|nr:hypothetical protein [Clostridiales bacterium]